MAQRDRASMVTSLHISSPMPCPVWLLLFSYSISITPSQSELVFLTQPKDGVGVLNKPLMLHCAAHDTSPQREIPVTWEKMNGEMTADVHLMANGSLFFSALKEENIGGYICRAKKGKNQIRSHVKVSKAYLEDVFYSPQSQTVDMGEDVFFQCVSGNSSPPAHISWLKNNRALTRGTQIQGQYGGGSQGMTTGTLQLINATKADRGYYACVTHNPLLNISKASGTATLIVDGNSMGLEIIQGPANITVLVEKEAALHCAVQGFPIPRVLWFKDDQILPNTSRWDLQDDGQLLVIERVLPEDEGIYYCEANNDKERVRSQPAYLLPAVMDWTFVLQPVNKTVRKGSSVTLFCRPPHSRPPAKVSWFKNNRALRSRPHFTMQPTGDLLFLSVQETDRGPYFCRASNSFLQRAISSRKIFLDILVPPSVTIWPLAVISTVGAEVVIQCKVSGHPVPSIEWSKQGQSVKTGGKVRMGERNATLYIASVRTYDEGFYTCAASSSVGQDKKTTSIHITTKPVIVLFAETVNVFNGANITLPCQAVGNPPMTYTWTRNAIQTSLSSHIHIDDNKTLHISNAHQSDAGEYHCTAENSMGQDTRKAIITVFPADPGEHEIYTISEIKLEKPATHTNYNYLEPYKDVYLKDQPTHSISASTAPTYFTGLSSMNMMNMGEKHKYKTILKTSQPLSNDNYSKPLETQKRHSHVTSSNPITQPPDSSSSRSFGLSYSERYHFTSSPVAPNDKYQTPGFRFSEVTHITSTALLEINQNWSQFAESLTATKASQINNTELVETLKKNTSKSTMRTTNNAREKRKSQSWLPVLEKHDIPIVVGVGVSLTFIFITMTFYSLFRKNDPAALITGRTALRGLGGPCKHGEHVAIERTYDNKAFEDDNMVAVIEESPNTSETSAHPPAPSSSTLLMESFNDDAQEQVQLTQDLPVLVETHPEPIEEQLETSFEEGKVTPSLPSTTQFQCMEDWRSQDLGHCQDAPSPPSANTVDNQEGLRASLTLQTNESSSTPVHHSISLSHGSYPLLLSHCVTMGMTSVAVDVHFYPSTVQNSFTTAASASSASFRPARPQGECRLEHDLTAPSAHRSK